jgi:hypothetical protein
MEGVDTASIKKTRASRGSTSGIWNHFQICWVDGTSPLPLARQQPIDTEPSEDEIGRFRLRRRCTRENCGKHFGEHPKEGYRHVKNCAYLSAEERADIIESCPETERLKYREYWDSSE